MSTAGSQNLHNGLHSTQKIRYRWPFIGFWLTYLAGSLVAAGLIGWWAL